MRLGSPKTIASGNDQTEIRTERQSLSKHTKFGSNNPMN
jgi:hypothetical protein